MAVRDAQENWANPGEESSPASGEPLQVLGGGGSLMRPPVLGKCGGNAPEPGYVLKHRGALPALDARAEVWPQVGGVGLSCRYSMG